MEERPFEFNGIPVKTPNAFKPNLATTSTPDSGRTQDLAMHNMPMGTIQNGAFEWEYIELDEAALILSQIVDKSEYSLRHPNPLTGKWEVSSFYTTNISIGSHAVSSGKDVWKTLSFNAIKMKPV